MHRFLSLIGKTLRRRYYLLTAILVFLSFPSFDTPLLKGFPVFAWFCLVPLFLAARRRGYKRLYLASFFTFLPAALFTWGWMGSFGGNTFEGHLVIWALLLPCIAFLFAGRVLAAEFLSRRYPAFRVFIYPSIWLLGDLIQSLGYLAFPWNYLGYSQYPVLPFVQASSVIGILGVSFLIAAGNTIIAEFIAANRTSVLSLKLHPKSLVWKKVPAAFLAVIVLITAAGTIRLLNGIPKSEKTYRIAAVQSCISPWADWERLKYAKLGEIIAMSDRAILPKPDLLVWSESATLEPVSYRARIGNPDRFDEMIMDYARTKSVPILTGEIGVIDDPVRMIGCPQNSAVLVDKTGTIAGDYAKIHLCPFGEWFPYGQLFPWIRDIALEMGGSDFVPGNTPVKFTAGGASFGVLICYEGMFFRLPAGYKRMGADFLVNITNDGWSGSYGGHFQHFAAAPFRAAENGMWFIRVGNDGYTAVLDPLGRTTRSIPVMKQGVMNTSIQLGGITTIYSLVGDLFSYCILGLCALLCAIGEIRIFRKRIKRAS